MIINNYFLRRVNYSKWGLLYLTNFSDTLADSEFPYAELKIGTVI